MFSPEKPGGISLLHGDLLPVDRQRVLVAYVDVGPRGAYSETLDDQTFDYLMGVAFVQGAVFEYVGLAFVRVADDVLGSLTRLAPAVPLDARREARASAAAQARICDRLDHFVRAHIEQNALEGFVAATSDIVVYRFGVNVAQVAGNYTLL